MDGSARLKRAKQARDMQTFGYASYAKPFRRRDCSDPHT